MGYSYKTYAETKDVMKKYVNATEGSIIYSMSKTHLMTLVNKAGALYKVGNSALINTEIFLPLNREKVVVSDREMRTRR